MILGKMTLIIILNMQLIINNSGYDDSQWLIDNWQSMILVKVNLIIILKSICLKKKL